MLLTHTSGYAYSFYNDALNNWWKTHPVDELDGTLQGINLPLIFEVHGSQAPKYHQDR